MKRITTSVSALVRSLGDLTPEQQVYAATAKRLAELLDAPDAAPYTVSSMVRELRSVVAALKGDRLPPSAGVPDDEFDALVRGLTDG